MQTRKAPPRAGSLAEATAAEARGQGRRKPTQGAAPASVFQEGPMGPMADLGMARGVRQVDPALPALSNNLLKSAQLPSASAEAETSGPARCFWRCKYAFADMDANLP